MNQIKYVKGNAVHPQGIGDKIIVHICNNVGLWGAGFVLALSRIWPEPEAAYRDWCTNPKATVALGMIQPVVVARDIMVINMIAQHNVGTRGGIPPIRYEALYTCLEKVVKVAKDTDASVHMPRIGCGLSGGHWNEVEAIIKATLIDAGVPVTVYDL